MDGNSCTPGRPTPESGAVVPVINARSADRSSVNKNADHFPATFALPDTGPGPSSIFAATIAELQLRVKRHDTERAFQRTTDAVVRGAAAGLALRGGLNIVSYALGILMKSKQRKVKNQHRPGIKELVQDALRWGAFLGCFSGIFVSTDEAIACFAGAKRTAPYRAILAGALAGPALLLTGPKTTHTSLALYVLLRGITLLVRCGNLPTAAPWKRRLLTPTRWKHGDVFLMCLSTSQIGYSWLVLPHTLAPSYRRFLDKHGGKEMYILEAVREMSRQVRHGIAPGSSPISVLKGTPFQGFHGNVPCEILHPGMTCNQHLFKFFPEGYLRALPVYLPVYVIPAALVHRQKLLRGDYRAELWKKIALGALRSSAFLSLYVDLAWLGACAGWNIAGGTSVMALISTCWIAGLATFVEKKSRRMELALYCLSRSLEAFSLTLVHNGYVNKKLIPGRLDVLLFSAATACICHCYSDHWGARRDVFRSKYLTVFDFVLGNQGFADAGIKHSPSNGQLLTALSVKLSRSMKSISNLAALDAEEIRMLTPIKDVSDGEKDGGGEGGGSGGGVDSDNDEGPWPSARSSIAALDSEEDNGLSNGTK
ncbi:hypothetical protein Ndes2526B_g03184 [Nannochloris sp. 'desiccata']|nr:hypothetical protein KSW81_006588 [Chlorella desiccata (nom. nud.)]KAH7622356.1 putative Transmembrane protein 135-like [Chlorella desiccata (nom. nud.)]